MARIDHVKHARKSPGTCGACGKVIEGRVADDQNRTITMGEAYKSFSPRYGSRRVRHESCPTWRPSEMTGSKMAEVMAAEEDFDSGAPYTTASDLEDAMNLVAEAARSVGEQYQESASNIVDGFGHETFQSDELQEKGDELSAWADDIESRASEANDIGCGECSEDEDEHHDFAASTEEDGTCAAVEGCELTENEHHEFAWDESAGDELAGIVHECPV